MRVVRSKASVSVMTSHIHRLRSIKKKHSILSILVLVSLGLMSGFVRAAIIVPEPPNLADFIQDRNAAIRLGKALFWDMQVGSDGVTACASCHFRAGADGGRARNQLSPGLLGGDETFQTAGPNHALQIGDFPFHELSDPDDRNSPVLSESNDVASSQGVFLHEFVAVTPGSPLDQGLPRADGVFNVNGVNVRRVEPRNTPSVINAVANFANFWDGRANNIFNGVNPFGPSDLSNGVFVNSGGVLTEQLVRISNSSLASQAVGPPLSSFEMSFSGRTFADIGKKILSLRPLAKQFVHPQDSVLGPLSRATLNRRGQVQGQRGLNTTYSDMIKASFQPKFWNSAGQMIAFVDKGAFLHEPSSDDPRAFQLSNGFPIISSRPGRPLAASEFTQMEANFSLFFGLAVQMYEATLVSDDTRVDRFLTGDSTALTAQEQQGFDIFQKEGKCIECHGGAEFTNATVAEAGGLIPKEIDLAATLNGSQEAPPVTTPATGTATFVIDALRTFIVFDLRVQNIVDVTAAHIHAGAPGEDGPIIFTLSSTAFAGRLTGTLTAANFIPVPGIPTFADALNAMADGDTYINAHTIANPGGEIRGQIETAILNLEATMTGDQEVPPVSTAARGTAAFTVDAARRSIEFDLRVQNITGVTAAHIHSGVPGENGPVIFVLSDDGFADRLLGIVGPGDFIPVPGIPTFDAALDAMLNGDTYVNVHSAANPDGEIRGQILPRPEGVVVLIELMNMAQGRAFYDIGFYNIGVTPTAEDVGRGAASPFGFPLSFARLAMLKRDALLPSELAQFVPDLPPGATNPLDRVAADGGFKVPGLRNVELTAPYFHNGGAATLMQVVDFYKRGGNFHEQNIDNLDPFIDTIGGLDEAKQIALVAFLLALTDGRVRNETTPFDHPELFVPNGSKGDETAISGNCGIILQSGFRDCERVMRIPPVGAGGRPAAGLPPLQSVVDQFQP